MDYGGLLRRKPTKIPMILSLFAEPCGREAAADGDTSEASYASEGGVFLLGEREKTIYGL